MGPQQSLEEKGDFPHDRCSDSPPLEGLETPQQAAYLVFLKLSLSQRFFLLGFSPSLPHPPHSLRVIGPGSSVPSGEWPTHPRRAFVCLCALEKASAPPAPTRRSPRQPQHRGRASAGDCPHLASGWQRQLEPVKWARWGFSLFPAF